MSRLKSDVDRNEYRPRQRPDCTHADTHIMPGLDVEKSVDPLTPAALKALRLAVSGSETGLGHHSDRSLARFLRAKKTVERAAENVNSYDALWSYLSLQMSCCKKNTPQIR